MRQRSQTYAITSSTYQGKHVFQRTSIAELFIATLFRYRDSGKFKLHGFAVMPEHVHILLTPAPDVTIERSAQLIKGGFSFAIRKDYPGEVWHEGYYAYRITDEEDYRNQLLYVANNPERKHLEDYPHIHTTPAYAGRLDS
jgi:putative transposase